jgi:hypothetical protein
MSRVVREDGTVRLRIIAPGQGSSAYYEAGQLKRDAAVFRNAQVFWDHPSTREEKERPERSLRDLCGVAVADPVYEENGIAGPGLYTDVKVFKPYRPIIEEMGPHIGVSIRAAGSVVTKKVGTESRRVAEKFTSGGFDFVTKAGAGGAVVPLQESARPGVTEFVESFLAAHPQESESSESARAQFIEWATGETHTPHQEEDDMELKEKVATLETENAALKESLQRANEALVLKEAGEIVDATILAEKDLPEMTRARIRESLKLKTPLKEGALDKEALTALIAETIKSEKAYVESLKPKGVVGMGGSGGTDDGKARLRESLIAMHIQNGEAKEKAERLADLAILGR